MSRTILACVLVVALALCALFAGTVRWQTSSAVASQKRKGDRDIIEVREIELSTVYSTVGQRKLIRVYDAFDADTPDWMALSEIQRALRESESPPMLTIVRGDSGKEAVLATARHFGEKVMPARPVGPNEKSTCKKHWLFVHLANGHSSPLKWWIFPPTIYGAKVRFYYRRFDGWFTPEPDIVKAATEVLTI